MFVNPSFILLNAVVAALHKDEPIPDKVATILSNQPLKVVLIPSHMFDDIIFTLFQISFHLSLIQFRDVEHNCLIPSRNVFHLSLTELQKFCHMFFIQSQNPCHVSLNQSQTD